MTRDVPVSPVLLVLLILHDTGAGKGKMVGGFGQRCFSGGVEEENTPEGRRPDQPVGEDTPKLRMGKQRKELQCLSKLYPFLEKLRLVMGAT